MIVHDTVAGVRWVFKRDPQSGMWVGQSGDEMNCLAESLPAAIESAERVMRRVVQNDPVSVYDA